jgi:dUTP pyrophosphatase
MVSELKFIKVKNVKSPTRGTEQSAGIDFFVPDEFETIVLLPGESCFIASGIKVSLPDEHVLIAFNKSGIAVKKNLHVGACVVDADYQGELHINLTNTGNSAQIIERGDKIVQFVLLPVNYAMPVEVEPKDLYKKKSARGEGGFGSTGTK